MLTSQGEPFHQTKTRIQERLGVPEKDFAKFKFSLVASTVFKQPSVIEDGESEPAGSSLSVYIARANVSQTISYMTTSGPTRTRSVLTTSIESQTRALRSGVLL